MILIIVTKKQGSNYRELINYQFGMYLAGYVPKTAGFSDERLRSERNCPQNSRFFGQAAKA
jgi:hypothetical protein